MEENGCFYISGQIEGIIRKNKTFMVVNIFDKNFGNMSCTLSRENMYSLFYSRFDKKRIYHFKAKVKGEQFIDSNNKIKTFNNIILIEHLTNKGGMPN